jgi:hypothetical protein
MARAGRGAGGTVTALPPLRVMTGVRCPRSRPGASMLAPAASDTRSPFSAGEENSACPAGEPGPAATSAGRPVLVNTGTAGTRAADAVVVIIGHLRGRAGTRRLGPPKSQRR